MAFEVMNVGSIPTPVTNILVDGKLTSWELALFAKQKVRHLTDACRERNFPKPISIAIVVKAVLSGETL